MHKRLDQLTFTRFISAFAILWAHYKGNTDFDNLKVNELLFPFLPVSYFFMLSGFVLGISYIPKIGEHLNSFNFKDYFVRRFARIYPIYLLALVLELSYLYFYDAHRFPGVKAIILNVFLIQGWAYDTIVNFPSWSLSCEAFYYSLFPFILFCLKRLDTKQLISTFIIVWIIQQFVCYFFFNVQHIDFGFRFNPLVHLPTFIFGVIAALIFEKNQETLAFAVKPVANLLLVFVIVNIMFGKSFIGLESIQNPLFIVFILIVATPDNFFVKYFNTSFFITLGFVSYSLYILQLPVHSYFELLCNRVNISNPNYRFLLYIPFVIGFSYFTYFFFEKKIYNLIIKPGKLRSGKTIDTNHAS